MVINVCKIRQSRNAKTATHSHIYNFQNKIANIAAAQGQKHINEQYYTYQQRRVWR